MKPIKKAIKKIASKVEKVEETKVVAPVKTPAAKKVSPKKPAKKHVKKLMKSDEVILWGVIKKDYVKIISRPKEQIIGGHVAGFETRREAQEASKIFGDTVVKKIKVRVIIL